MTDMILHRKDIERIQDILSKFPEVTVFEIHQDRSSGIGSCTYISFAHEMNGHRGNFEVEVSGVEDW